jgi:formamidopyrimidine-DNA glycosylase
VSIELPEALILSQQLSRELQGKTVKSWQVKDCERMQRIGMLDKDMTSFNLLVGGKVTAAVSRGNAIRVNLNNGSSLILAPEYGGHIFFHPSKKDVPSKFHLKVDFNDSSALTVRLTSMGHFSALKDSDLERSYIYRRDFNPAIASPIEEAFTFKRFSQLLTEANRALKSVLVGKDAIVVGLSNSAFQDIIFRAKLHPKRKASDLMASERQALFDAIGLVLRERIRLKGKTQFLDLYGVKGRYEPAMGPNMKQRPCPTCQTPIEKLSVGGGHVYLCPKCQV